MPNPIQTATSRMGDRFAAWRHRRRLERELGALSDRQLDDLGFARSDIPRVARGQVPSV